MPSLSNCSPPARFLVLFFLLLLMLVQSGCIVIGAVGAVATTAVKSTVSIAGHTVETAVDIVTPDGDEEKDGEE